MKPKNEREEREDVVTKPDYNVALVPPEDPFQPGLFVATEGAPFVRNPYNYDRNQASNESGVRCTDASLAVQESKDEADINWILKQYGITGNLPQNIRAPEYGDFTGINNYQDALNALIAADESFMAMPAHVRDRFHNNPEAFVEFCSKEENKDEMRKMGLIEGPLPTPKDPPIPADPTVVVPKTAPMHSE